MLAKFDLGIVDPVEEPLSFQISLQPIRSSLVCLVTGMDCFKYLTLEENLRSFVEAHGALDTQGVQLSTEYTCHSWTRDTGIGLVLATAQGEFIVCSMTGEFIISVPDAPGIRIDCIVPW